jgi:hypothetical protein
MIIGFDCNQSAPASSGKPPQGSARSLQKGLLKGLLSSQGSCLYSDETHYSDEYETDDEFFVEGSDDLMSEEHQSSQFACSSPPASGSPSQSSEPIDIPYKK